MIRLYCTQDLREQKSVELSGECVHYLKNVMRKNINDSFLIFNGKDGEWKCEINEITKKSIIVSLKEQTAPQGVPADINLYFSLVKKDKTDLIIEKATELNIASINPIITERTITSRTNIERLKLIAIEAAEQCERTHLPIINEPVKFSSLLSVIENSPDKVFFIMDERGLGKLPIDAFPRYKNKTASFIIGPEGGFTNNEFSLIARYNNVVNISLGGNILRAETAVISAISAWHTLCGDFC